MKAFAVLRGVSHSKVLEDMNREVLHRPSVIFYLFGEGVGRTSFYTRSTFSITSIYCKDFWKLTSVCEIRIKMEEYVGVIMQTDLSVKAIETRSQCTQV
jgi:hypothetical protein